MDRFQRRALGDIVKDSVVESWYSSSIQQKLFGGIPTIQEFVTLTRGEIAVKPQFSLVSSPSYSVYPFEFSVEYTASPNGVLMPFLSKQLSHYETVERLTEDDYLSLSENSINDKLYEIGLHKKTKLDLFYQRDAVVDLGNSD